MSNKPISCRSRIARLKLLRRKNEPIRPTLYKNKIQTKQITGQADKVAIYTDYISNISIIASSKGVISRNEVQMQIIEKKGCKKMISSKLKPKGNFKCSEFYLAKHEH